MATNQPTPKMPVQLYLSTLKGVTPPSYVWLCDTPDQLHLVSDTFSDVREMVKDCLATHGSQVTNKDLFTLVILDEIKTIFYEEYLNKFAGGEFK